MIRKCGNCRNRRFPGFGGFPEYCCLYENAETEEEEIAYAAECGRYEEKTLEDRYCPSAAGGDYGPGNPWDAPEMSIRDFI